MTSLRSDGGKILLVLTISLFAGCVLLFADSVIFRSGYEERVILLMTLNILFTIVPFVVYIVRNRYDIKIFSPYCAPLFILIVTYTIPSLILVVFERKIIDDTALAIQLAGAVMYVLGIATCVVCRRNVIQSGDIGNQYQSAFSLRKQKITMNMLFVIGLALLITYSWISGITWNILTGSKIDSLRRSAEIGKGFIKEPGIFLITISAIWLACYYFVENKRFIKAYFLFLFIISLIVFLSTGHKTQSLWVLIFAIGVYNKYQKMTLLGSIKFGLLLLLLIIVMNTIISGENGRFISVKDKALVLIMPIYEINFLPLVKLVKSNMLNLQYGKEYLQNAMIIIPRFIWPTKPLDYGYFLKELLNLDFAGGGVPPTVLGSFYINFGFYGVTTGMFVMGFFYRWIYNIYVNKTDFMSIVMIIYVLSALLDPSSFLSKILLATIFVFFAHSVHKIFSEIRK